MERATMKDEHGYYLVGDGIYSDWGVLEKFRGDDIDRLAAYEGTGLEPEEIELMEKQRDLYVDACGGLPLRRIRELVQADKEERCIILPDPQKTPVLRKGTPVWYVDNETGEIEPGKVFIASYKDGKLDSFSVDFECGDFDEFVGSALGNCFFGSKEQAEAALRREQDG